MVLTTQMLNAYTQALYDSTEAGLNEASFSTGDTIAFQGNNDYTFNDEVIRKSTTATPIGVRRMLVSASIDSSEANGNTITDFGTGDGTINSGTNFQIRQYGSISPGVGKTSAVELWVDVELHWTYTQQ